MPKSIGLIAGFLVLSAAVFIGSWILGGKYLDAQNNTNICKKIRIAHLVTLQNDQASPLHTYGKRCDIITIINKDTTIRLIAFGPHEHHQPYDGITEQALGLNQGFKIILNEAGTYHFHDHIEDIIQGEFTVSN